MGITGQDLRRPCQYRTCEQRVHVRTIDHVGGLTSLDQIISEELTGATSLHLAHGPYGYGALMEADSGEGGTALYFMGISEDGSPIGSPRRLTPVGVDVLTQRPQLLWHDDAWIAVWSDTRPGFQFARGRFECP